MKTKLSTYTILKRTIETLQDCYPNQKIERGTILKCINDNNFLSTYIYY